MARVEKACATCERSFVAEYSTKTYCSRSCWLSRYNELDQDGHGARGAKAAGQANIERLRGTGKGYVKEYGRHQHRVVAERVLGRPLTPKEVVHHKDRDRSNNTEENLQVLSTQAEHAALHQREGW